MEEWRDIPGYEGLYQASTEGRIRTVEGKVTSNSRYSERHWKSRILKGRGDCSAGKRVCLWKDGNKKDCLVARLVALTYLGNPPDKFTVNHKDGNRLNNKIENLEWLSRGDNIRHGFETGLYHSQKPIIAKSEKGEMYFRSYAQFDRFLGRHVGYTSNCLNRHIPIKSDDGVVYEITKSITKERGRCYES